MNVLIETNRLIIRPLLPTDKEGMFQLDSNPEVHRYVGKKPVKTVDESAAVIEFIRQQYVDFGIGRWAVVEKGTNEFIGWMGFKLFKGPVNKHADFYDFGYRLREEYWGRGYATEAGVATLHYGIDTFGFTDIYAMTDVNNIASRRVLEKMGFALACIFDYDGELTWRTQDEPTTWYEYRPLRLA
jgi:[ribosomal protein S5]-alanine N-acetyltransferase